MSYATVEAGALAVLRKHGDFDATNTSQGDWRVLAAGKARIAVLSLVGDSPEAVTLTVYQHHWQTAIDLMIPWPGEQDAFDANIKAEAQKVWDTFRQWPKLDGVAGVTHSQIVTTQEPQPTTTRDGGWRGVRLVLQTDEIQTAEFQE